MAAQIVFRCDADPRVGTGHVMRCLSLAEAFANRKWECTLASRPGTFEALWTHIPRGVNTVAVDAAPNSLRRVIEDGCDILVVDHYGLDARYERALRPWARRILVIDDLADRPHDCDFLLDPTLGRKAADYIGLIPEVSQTLLGPSYAPLRPAFAEARPLVLKRRMAGQDGEQLRILIAIGGLPERRHLHHVLSSVYETVRGAHIDVVAPRSSAESRADKMDSVVWHHRVEDMASLMGQCDLSVGAGGTTAWERCCLGVPSVILEVADNQRMVAQALGAAGAAITIGKIDSDNVAEQIGTAVESIATNPHLRMDMARQAALVCDGLGARRVVATFNPEHSTDGRSVSLRPVDLRDSKIILDLQSEPEARRYAKTPDAPSPQEHHVWFLQRLANPQHGPFELIMLDGKPVGFIRIDMVSHSTALYPGYAAPMDRPVYLLSILISQQTQGRGVASAALRLVARLLKNCTVYAEVLQDNVPSQRLFHGAGYRKISSTLFRYDINHFKQ